MPCPHFGNYPAEYNRAVHGNYYPFRYYGKPDTPLADVKISELGSWLNRRNVHPVAMIQAWTRWFHRHAQRFIHPRYAYPGVGYNQKMVMLVLLFTALNYKTLRHHKQYKHHW